jgi:DNA topoisomerase-3
VVCALQEGQVVPFKKAPQIVQKTLDPPPRFTEASLLSAMANIANVIDDPELREAMKAADAGLATPATRAQIIELLIARGYIQRQKKQLVSTPLGRALIKTVTPELADPSGRAKMERLLNDFSDPTGPDKYLEDIHQLVQRNIEYCRALAEKGTARVTIGVSCPECGSEIALSARTYHCVQCQWRVYRTFHGHALTESEVRDLITHGETQLVTLQSQKTGKTFRAKIALEAGRLVIRLPTPEDLQLGPCPLCKDGVIYEKTDKLCACTACDYTFWRIIAGVRLSSSQLRRLFQKGSIPSIRGFRKRNNERFTAGLKLDANGKAQFVPIKEAHSS